MILEWLKKLFGIKRTTGFNAELQKVHYEANYKIGGIGDLFKYTPKHTERYVLATLGIRDQAGQRSCVVESAATQKEVDEGVRLSPQSLAAYLLSVGMITRQGTSLSAAQDGLRHWGMAEHNLTPNKYFVDFSVFASPRVLTNEVVQNAAKHKTESYYTTQNLNKVLEELDNGKKGHTASEWWSNHYNLRTPFVYGVGAGNLDYHAYDVVGYWDEKKILICENSFGEEWGEDGYFYIRYEDFNRVFKWGVYFNSDMPKDLVGWLSIHAGQAVKEKNGPKIYLIQSDKKHHIPDEVIWHLLGKTTSTMEDMENVLPEVKEGDPIKIEDIPADRVAQVKEEIRLLNAANFVNNDLRDKYKKVFPDLFN